MTESYNALSIRSPYLVRIYISNIILIVETVLYFLYPSSTVLSVFQLIYCFTFGLWVLGLLSDTASMTLILVNWVNNVVFG